jgi:hypothetical protein
MQGNMKVSTEILSNERKSDELESCEVKSLLLQSQFAEAIVSGETQPLLLELEDVIHANEKEDELLPNERKVEVRHQSGVSKKHQGLISWCRAHKRDVIIAVVVGLVVGVLLAIPAAFAVDPIREYLRTKPVAFVSGPDAVTFKSAKFVGFADPNGVRNLLWKFSWDLSSKKVLSFSSALQPLLVPSVISFVVDVLQPGVEYAYQVVVQDTDSAFPPTKSDILTFSTKGKPNGTLRFGGCWSSSNSSSSCSLLPGIGLYGWLGTPDGKHVFAGSSFSSGCMFWRVVDDSLVCTNIIINGGMRTYLSNNFLYTFNNMNLTFSLNSFSISENGELFDCSANVAPFWNKEDASPDWSYAVSANDMRIVFVTRFSIYVGSRESTKDKFLLSGSIKLASWYPFSAISDEAVYGLKLEAGGFEVAVWSISELKLVHCLSSNTDRSNCGSLPSFLVPLAPISMDTGEAILELQGKYLVVSLLGRYDNDNRGLNGISFVINFLFEVGPHGILVPTPDFCFTSLAGTLCKMLPGEFNSKLFFSKDFESVYAIGTSTLGDPFTYPLIGTAIVEGIVSVSAGIETVPPPFGCVGVLSSTSNPPACITTFPSEALNIGSGDFFEQRYLMLVTETVVYYQNMWFRREMN